MDKKPEQRYPAKTHPPDSRSQLGTQPISGKSQFGHSAASGTPVKRKGGKILGCQGKKTLVNKTAGTEFYICDAEEAQIRDTAVRSWVSMCIAFPGQMLRALLSKCGGPGWISCVVMWKPISIPVMQEGFRDASSPDTVGGNWRGSQIHLPGPWSAAETFVPKRTGPASNQLVTVIILSQAKLLRIILFLSCLRANFI